jgi:hypothetical protein
MYMVKYLRISSYIRNPLLSFLFYQCEIPLTIEHDLHYTKEILRIIKAMELIRGICYIVRVHSNTV